MGSKRAGPGESLRVAVGERNGASDDLPGRGASWPEAGQLAGARTGCLSQAVQRPSNYLTSHPIRTLRDRWETSCLTFGRLTSVGGRSGWIAGSCGSGRTPGMEAEEASRPFLPWLGRACRQAREERDVVQVKIAAAIEVNQATIARFEDGTAWPRRPEEVLMAYANVLDMDVRLLWLHAFVLWLEHEPVLDSEGQEEFRAALKRLG